MSPRDDEKGNYDDTEFPPDSENADDTQHDSDHPDPVDARQPARANSDDEGDYDDKDQ